MLIDINKTSIALVLSLVIRTDSKVKQGSVENTTLLDSIICCIKCSLMILITNNTAKAILKYTKTKYKYSISFGNQLFLAG